MNTTTLKRALTVWLTLLMSLAALSVWASEAEALRFDGFAEGCAMSGGYYWADPTGYSYCVYNDGYIICDGIEGWCEWRPRS